MNNILLANDHIITVDVIVFTLLFFVFFYWFSKQKFSGDAAGAGLERGLTYLYGIIVLSIIALILSIIHFYLIKDVTTNWLKYFAFLPIGLILIVPVYPFLKNFIFRKN